MSSNERSSCIDKRELFKGYPIDNDSTASLADITFAKRISNNTHPFPVCRNKSVYHRILRITCSCDLILFE